MRLRHLLIFKCICEEMNMTKAAKKLYMSQPSVSQAVKELEEHYKINLFERLGHKLHLTEAGKELLKYAEHMLAVNSELEEIMKSKNRMQRIRIGATVTIGTYCLPRWIAEFYRKVKGVDIISSIKNTKDIEDNILNSAIDLGLVEGDIDSQDIIVTPFLQDELIVICSKNHPISKKGVLEIDDLEKEKFLIREVGSGSRRLFLETIKSSGASINIVGEFNNNEAIKNGVYNNLGLGVVSRTSIDANDTLVQLTIKDIHMIRDYSIAYHKNKLINRGMKEFVNYIVNLN